jgi:hypothetical protein
VGIGCVDTDRGTTETRALNDPIGVSGAVKESEAIQSFLLKLQLTPARKQEVTSNLQGHHRNSLRSNSVITTIVSNISVLKCESLRYPNGKQDPEIT